MLGEFPDVSVWEVHLTGAPVEAFWSPRRADLAQATLRAPSPCAGLDHGEGLLRGANPLPLLGETRDQATTCGDTALARREDQREPCENHGSFRLAGLAGARPGLVDVQAWQPEMVRSRPRPWIG